MCCVTCTIFYYIICLFSIGILHFLIKTLSFFVNYHNFCQIHKVQSKNKCLLKLQFIGKTGENKGGCRLGSEYPFPEANALKAAFFGF